MRKTVSRRACAASLQERLETELERLSKLCGLEFSLKVAWQPEHGTLSGTVKNNVIYVYEAGDKAAIETLRHEFLDYCVSQAIQPYKEVTNLLIRKINDDAYQHKEKIVEALAKLLDIDASAKTKER